MTGATRKVVVRQLARPVLEVPRPRPNPLPLDCPICGREMECAPHQAHTPFTAQHHWLIYRLGAMGIAAKVIAKIIHSTPNTIGTVLADQRRQRRLS